MSINLTQLPKRDLKKGKFYVVDSNNKKHYFGDTTFYNSEQWFGPEKEILRSSLQNKKHNNQKS